MENQQQTFETIKLVISVVALVLSLISLISALLIYLSTRASVCNQIYGRWQTLLLAQDEEIATFLKDIRCSDKV